MRIVVVGGAGRIGAPLVTALRTRGHDVVAASRRTGVDAVTGSGLAAAVAGADVVVDVSRSPSLGDRESFDFFTSATRNVLTAEASAGVRHHVALSVVGARRMAPEFGFMRAKVAQEELVETSGRPYTIVAATQFFEFVGAIADVSTVAGEVRLPPLHDQPIAALDVAGALAAVAEGAPRDGTAELAGPEVHLLPDLVAHVLRAAGDPRRVVVDADAPYFSAHLDVDDLLPRGRAILGTTRFEEWLARPSR